MDETFIGGKAKNMHLSKRREAITGRGPKDKTAVMGIIQRGGDVRAFVVPSRKKKDLQKRVREHVEAGSAVFSDELRSYEGLNKEYIHAVVDHIREWVHGNVHTNTIENFWSLFKRGVIGSFHKVSVKHLHRYLGEFTYRFNNRAAADLFQQTVSRLTGGIPLPYRALVANE